MGTLVRFKTDQDHVVEALEDLLQRARDGQIKGFVFAADLDDGNVATAWSNRELMQRAYLVTHLQADITYGVIEANIDRLIEYV
ncbi:hypothetical protein M5X00_29950 [Paenibacillus alvei]|uniref:Uncharacterized protein n=1 Tax=Paenibacillus alvei TaxID=44250 RepID=A0ABT4H100_PAEAL|nr:hypothetical protein [Paenibacillus alvei]EJW14446.1 hypothetical protein PAV_13c00650 [Paenibacillus alvei DSM 29]MCY9543731.1 hypothetical protein [Paenibacillus alvei]MCY9708206.1 hypothetical protein [Paenibacillus alvei]MCY9737914.1 hypothetical protein [Paenibacillus alvei]MCY9758446.1 hypothetical protein [Paenibacillus alvei]